MRRIAPVPARSHMVLLVCLAAIAAASHCRPTQAASDHEGSRPNFVIVLADDLGYGDLACYGHPTIQSPNIDRLAAEGMRFTSCYAAAANCSPARTGLMTGRTPYRVGIHTWIPMFSPMHVRQSEVTVATLLRRAGYETCHVGKWHLNGRFNLPGQPQPSDHGFDYWFSTQNNALPSHHNPDNFVRNGQPAGKLEGYSAQLVVDEAIRWLTKERKGSGPFFLFVCFHEPHEPIATAKRFRDLYPSDDPSLSTHHGNITQMDFAFGRLMHTLDELKLRDSTFVLFTSDNGPAVTNWHPHGSTGPLRAKKGHLYEGGIRVPGIVRWPGHVPAGVTCDEPISGVDLLPTVCQIVGIPLPKDRTIDGASIVPVFHGKPIRRKTPLYWQYNFARSKPKVAMRVGDWKILGHLSGPELKPGADITPENQQSIKHAELVGFELYNLRNDIGETTDLAEKEPQRLAELAAQMRAMYRQVREETPVWPVWRSPHYEGQRIRVARDAGIWPEWKKPPRAGRPSGKQSSGKK